MTDIELVIKIPKEYYEFVIERCKEPILLNAFKKGTPLQKGHGRLIDADALKFYEIDEIGGEYNPYLGCSKEQIDNAPTIIEADKESEK